MAKNYTPLDLKKFGINQQKKVGKVDAILIGIILVTLVVLGVLGYVLFQKSFTG